MKSDPARFRVVDPPLVDLEPDDEPGFKVEVLEQPPDFEIDEVTSTTNWYECAIILVSLVVYCQYKIRG
jgi:hypothetical protein